LLGFCFQLLDFPSQSSQTYFVLILGSKYELQNGFSTAQMCGFFE